MSRVPEVDPEHPLNDEEYDMIGPVFIEDLYPPLKGFDDYGDYDGGIGLRHVENNLRVTLVLSELLPLNTQIYLYWSNPELPVDYILIRPENQENRFFELEVRKEEVLADWAEVYCIIRRPSNNHSKTKPLRLRVKRDRPGDPDPNPDIPGNQGLVFTLPDDLAAGSHVDQDRANQGIRLTVQPYENMAGGDTCFISWGSQTVSYVVSEKELRQSFDVVVTADVISHDDYEEALPVAMQIIDMGGNYPAPNTDANWSEISRVNVNLGVYRPDAPWLKQPGEIIDMDELGGAAQLIELLTEEHFFERGDTVRLQWQGRDIHNVPFFHTESRFVDRINHIMQFEIENELLRAISGGIAIMYYEVYKIVTDTWYPSRKVRVRVIGRLMDWPAPTIDQAPNGQLAPDSIAVMRFSAQDGWTPGTRIRVVWVAHSVNFSEEIFLEAIPEDRRLSFQVSSEQVRRFNTLPVEVYYERIDYTPHRQSLRMQLQVGEPARTLPAVTVEKTFGNNLDPADIGTHVTVTVPLSDSVEGDIITLIWNGDALGTSVEVKLSKEQAGKALLVPIERRFVDANINRSVRIIYDLARADVPRRFSLIYVLRIQTVPGQYDLTNFTGSNLNGWVRGPALSDNRDIAFRTYSGNTVFHNYTYPPGNKAGVILSKRFNNLGPGRRYEFSLRARRFENWHFAPRLSLSTSESVITPVETLSTPYAWVEISGEFTANNSSITLNINSHYPTHEGNDYEIDDILFRSL
ncbi:hypothetical protein NVB75_03650 [Pseudomonas sp. CBS]|uniref:hypothetical protein n=1 Tax=Pseudomonas TaxID=286 RepID=UPI0021AD1163|nr:hypothetical protein [Pseudomonas sp. CBS]WEL64478.1 hypothetical protein P0D93_30985 [Pseudomonas sp. CBSPGW29]WEL73663.1 hypothetical protein P0D94_16905 [Pseudomonas sp. CBSPCGW29]WEL74973.1 hypothetical protein P0D92_22940 [Pseudomonas sp. CBSPAW29]WEL89302.1 hypothetical protein P0D90_05180 [Pseudomonas sp. CBSPCBW29]UVH51962.1 hypothetical protein NVB75_03650 [Pseudomonas sp. CBS]